MKIFFGGQIKDRCRGDLVAIVSINPLDEAYNAFVYPVLSDNFIELTGLRAFSYPLARVYMGISQETGAEILAHSQNRRTNDVNLDEIDKLAVSQYFINNNINQLKPQRIVLELSEDGYKVVESK